MRRSILIAIVIGFLGFLVAAVPARAQTAIFTQGRVEADLSVTEALDDGATDFTTLLAQLTVEVRKLRLDLLEQRLENQELKIAQLKRELEQVRVEQQEVQEKEQGLRQGIADLEKQLTESTLSATDREQLEAAKAGLVGNTLPRVRTEQQRIAEREAEVRERLERAEQEWQVLLDRAKAIPAEAGDI